MNYKKIRLPDGTTRDEHRIVAENMIGRKLRKNEIVHHINGNKQDNSFGNLEIMSRKKHAKLHLTGMKQSPESVLLRAEKLRGRACKARQTVSDEQIKKALDLYGSGATVRKIAEDAGFSHGTLFKLMKNEYPRSKEFSAEIKSAKLRRQLSR